MWWAAILARSGAPEGLGEHQDQKSRDACFEPLVHRLGRADEGFTRSVRDTWSEKEDRNGHYTISNVPAGRATVCSPARRGLPNLFPTV